MTIAGYRVTQCSAAQLLELLWHIWGIIKQAPTNPNVLSLQQFPSNMRHYKFMTIVLK